MGKNVRSFRDLVAWQKGMELADKVYEFSRLLPRAELFGLSAQMRKAAVSVASNVAEGFGRYTRPEYIRFLQIARGSLYETATQIELAARVKLVTPQQAEEVLAVATETGKILNGLISSLRAKRESQ